MKICARGATAAKHRPNNFDAVFAMVVMFLQISNAAATIGNFVIFMTPRQNQQVSGSSGSSSLIANKRAPVIDPPCWGRLSVRRPVAERVV